MSARDVIATFLEVRDENVTPADCDDQERADSAAAIVEALAADGHRILGPDELDRKFKLGDRVTKTKGSSWTGHIVGFYSTSLTPVGYCVESENEPGSVQIYPEAAIRSLIPAQPDAKEAPHD